MTTFNAADFSGPLSVKQQALLNQFRTNIVDILKSKRTLDSDENLLRWLRAREWDTKKAEKMLRDSLAWRASYGADTLMEWKVPEVLSKYMPGNYLAIDKEGYPTWHELTGMNDLKGLMFSATPKDIVKYRIYMIEHLFTNIFPECTKRAGKIIDKCNFIIDMEGVGMKHVSLPVASIYRELLGIVEANYPETLKVCYVINAPSILPLIYNLIKPFLADYTRTKIRFLGRNWKEDLLRDYNADQLPVHWGGTRTDPDGDPYCKSRINLGGPVPESYYLKNVTDNFDMSQFTTVTVNHGQSLQLDYKVVQSGSLLRWNFWTDGKDVAFGVFRRNVAATGGQTAQKTEDLETVVATSRVNCHLVPESGSIQCDHPGTYVIRFDNTYSWVNAKKLSYLIEVLLPEVDQTVLKDMDYTSF